MAEYLPKSLKEKVSTRPEDVMILDYEKGKMFCIDHVFAKNGLPYYNSEGELIENIFA